MDRLIESDDDDGTHDSVDNCAQITWHAFARVWLVCIDTIVFVAGVLMCLLVSNE